MKDVKQTFTFSATMNNDMKTIIKEHITEYEFIKIGDAVTVDKINHRYLAVDHEHKLSNLIKLIQTHSREKVIIFTHTKRNTKTIHDILMKNRFNAGMLNGNMSQNKRQ
jgi:superfamily II DNA/RNA helicase